MKNLYALLLIFLALVLISGCKNDDEDEENINAIIEYFDLYSTVDEYRAALIKLDSIAFSNGLIAYLDTLPDGMPDTNGNKLPLSDVINHIIFKLEQGEIEMAVDLTYKFDGQPFSLISYLIKARLANHIDNQMLITCLQVIPLPPIAVPSFTPPVQPVPVQQACVCNPQVKIKVVWAYKRNCGNREGYAVGNVLNNLPTGKYFKLIGELKGCNCPGTWTKDVQVIGMNSYSTGGKEPNVVDLWAFSSGTIKVTFKFTCTSCGKTAEETITLGFN